MPLRLRVRRRRVWRIPGNRAQIGPDHDHWRVGEIGLPPGVGVLPGAAAEPLAQGRDRVGPVGNDPEGRRQPRGPCSRAGRRNSAQASSGPNPRRPPSAARGAGAWGRARSRPSRRGPRRRGARAQAVLGAALADRDVAHPLAPADEMGIAAEERLELRVHDSPEALEIRLVERLVGGRRVAARRREGITQSGQGPTQPRAGRAGAPGARTD
jgi:hypothetical protein